jgi:NAD(P)-dependent dehydrogenase (short-subunit alcohol dehydrogenase family)
MPLELPSLSGKICVVTGATEGIGRVTALTLLAKGAKLGIVCRNPDKAKELASKGADVFLADLSRLKDVRRVAEELRAKYDRLDVLVNNAGAIFMERVMTPDGLETTFALNHLSYFLLTDLLRPLLEQAKAARIVNVASDAHKRGRIDFDNLQGEVSYSGFPAYSQSKLANIMFTYELARRLPKHVTANALHPGVVATGFGRGEHTRWLKPLISIARPFFITPEKGAETQLHLVASPAVEGVSGKYWAKVKEARSSTRSYDETVQKKLWDVSEELTAKR